MFCIRKLGSPRWRVALLVFIGCLGAATPQIGAAQDQPTVFLVPDGGTGVMLTDPDGWTLYTWFGDRPGVANCYGPCADAWPPYLVDGDVVAPIGMQAGLGTVPREDGTTQVALDGWPLYYFSGDGAPGTKTGDEVVAFNFSWQVAAYPPRVPAAANAPGVPVAVPEGPSPSFSAPPPPPGVVPTLIPAVSPFSVAPRAAPPAPSISMSGPAVIPAGYGPTVTVVAPPNGIIGLTWLPTPGAAMFRVYESPTSAPAGFTVTQTVQQPSGQVVSNTTLAGLIPGTTYFFQVRAVDSAAIESLVPSAPLGEPNIVR